MKCCICGKEIKDYGNNPSPLKNAKGEYFSVEDRCCDSCDDKYVIPMRLAQLMRDDMKMETIQSKVDNLQSSELKIVKHLIAVIERPDGSTYEQEIEYLNNSVNDSVKNAQALLGNPYYYYKNAQGKKVKALKSTAYLIVDTFFRKEVI